MTGFSPAGSRLQCRSVRRQFRFTKSIPSGSRPIRIAGSCTPTRCGTASATSKTATACSTRSRSPSSARGWVTTATCWTLASRPVCSVPIWGTKASSSRRPPTSRSFSCFPSASPRASGARWSTRCWTSNATTTPTLSWSFACPICSPRISSAMPAWG